jgi:hypothetical protein
MKKTDFRLVLILAIGLLTFGRPHPAEASNQVVSDCGDNGGANQLRAVIDAVQISGGGSITFSCSSIIVLNVANGTLPNITTNITIDGGNIITLSGNNSSRIFTIDPGATLTLNNLTLTKGYAASGDGGAIYALGNLNINGSKFLDNQTSLNGNGGAIISFGVLNISNSEFAYNKAASGGALYPTGATAVTTITGSNFHDNQAIGFTYGWGGAIYLSAGASVTIHSSSLSKNSAQHGGAIYAYQTTSSTLLTVTDKSALYTNSATMNGGGINADHATVVITHAFISNNSAIKGGGIYLETATAGLTNSTLGYNTANIGGGISISEFSAADLKNVTLFGNRAISSGGGIANYGTANLNNVTLSINEAASDGGGFWNIFGSAFLVNVTLSGNTVPVGGRGAAIYSYGPLTLVNTLIAKGSSGDNCYAVAGDFSLSDDGSCYFGAGRDNVNLLLGPLKDNGGPTVTHMPLPGSPAIDGGNGNWCPSTDQRGASRMGVGAGSACDVGAVETGVLPPQVYFPSIKR